MISPRTVSRNLRSTSDNYVLSIICSHFEYTSTIEFMCSAPTIWNKYTLYLCQITFHNTFKLKLKTYIIMYIYIMPLIVFHCLIILILNNTFYCHIFIILYFVFDLI